MNISLIIGWVLAFFLIIWGIVSGGEISDFIEGQSLAITGGGAIACLIASYPLSYLAGVPKKLIMAFLPKKYSPEKYIQQGAASKPVLRKTAQLCQRPVAVALLVKYLRFRIRFLKNCSLLRDN